MAYLTKSSPTLWERLTTPRQSVNARYRSRARILSGLTLATLYVGLVAAVGLLAAPRAIPWLTWATFALVAVSYVISRTRWPQAGGWLLTFGELAALLAYLTLEPGQQVNSQMLIFAVVPALLGTLVLMPAATVVLAVVTALGITVLVTLAPWMTFDGVMIPYVATLVITGLAASTALIRTDEVETPMDESTNKPQVELESDIWQMAAAAEVASALAGMRELDALLREAARECVRHFDLIEARVYLLDESARRGVLARRAEVGITVEDVAPTQQAIVREKAVVAPEDRLPPGAKAAVALPMRSGARALGMLELRSDTPGVFQDNVGILQAMADQIAAAVENTRLYEAAQSDLRGIERLAASLSEQEAAAAQTGYSIPLKVGEETVGVIDLSPGEDGEPPDEEMRRLVEIVARRVTEALETGQFDEPGGEVALRDEALNRFSTELQAATDVDKIMTVAVREASRTLGTGRAFITLSLQPGQEGMEG